MNNDELEIIRRKLQSRIDLMSNKIHVFVSTHGDIHWMISSAREEQITNKRLMAALVGLQRENKALWNMSVKMTKALLKL